MKWFLFLFWSASLYAAVTLPNPSVRVSGGALYWKPFQADLDYALRGPNILTLRSDYDGGYWLTAKGETEAHDYIEGGYAFYDTKSSDRASGSLTVPSLGLLNQPFAIASADFHYHTAYVHVGHTFCYPKGTEIYAFGGGRYLHIEENQLIQTESATYRHRLRFRSGGPEIGLGVRSCSLWGFRAFGEMRILAAIGKRQSTQNTVPVPSETVCIPVLFFKLGGLFEITCDRFYFKAEIGYALDYFFQLFQQNQQFGEGSPFVLTTELSDRGFGGPFVTLTVGY